MAGVLPRKVAERRDKLGFATPEAEWVRGPLGALAREGVEATLGRWPGLLDGPSARAMVEAMVAGRRAVDPSLWRIINLGIWGETFAVQA
jgi:asparagine synthase (glutamine-hydrolysing)